PLRCERFESTECIFSTWWIPPLLCRRCVPQSYFLSVRFREDYSLHSGSSSSYPPYVPNFHTSGTCSEHDESLVPDSESVQAVDECSSSYLRELSECRAPSSIPLLSRLLLMKK